MVSQVVRTLLRRVFEATDLDLRGVSWRLRSLEARHVDVSAVVSLSDARG
jgi:hypothetical protein